MIYRGPCSLSSVSKPPARRHTGRLRNRDHLISGWGGGRGWARSRINSLCFFYGSSIHQKCRKTRAVKYFSIKSLHVILTKRYFTMDFLSCTARTIPFIYIPFLEIVRPWCQFPHSCVYEPFKYSRIGPHISLELNRQTNPGNI
jgi:hypothetical protein